MTLSIVILTEHGAMVEEEQRPASESTPTATAMSLSSWHEQDGPLGEMWMKGLSPEEIAQKLGRTVAAVMTRVSRLGLPRRSSPGRKPGSKQKSERKIIINDGIPMQRQPEKLASAAAKAATRSSREEPPEEYKTQMAERICLMCLSKFMSQGRHNRICPSCKGTAEYAIGSSLPDVGLKTVF